MTTFREFFEEATGIPAGPYPYQCRLATGTEDGKTVEGVGCGSRLIHVPTGAGKTEAVVMAWVWNRVHRNDPGWPRRLVYCLPMRVLVEQTRDRAVLMLHRRDLLAGKVETNGDRGKERVKSYEPDFKDDKKIPVVILMGGETDDDWDRYPERNMILIGTQDMLLSRALNRGYAMSRSRWPMDFGLLNNDCLWVMDEVQLMGSGLSTSTQLQAWRESLNLSAGADDKKAEWPVFGRTHTWWMSATLQPDWLKSVDFEGRVPSLVKDKVELSPKERKELECYNAAKKLAKAQKQSQGAKKPVDLPRAGEDGYENSVAEFVAQVHNDQRQLTLVVLNTVDRAVKTFEALKEKTKAEVKLLHSRFRPHERKGWSGFLKREACEAKSLPSQGRIIVSTQVVEAGVDISAKVLVTELAPWPSLVQRFGRANRYGEYDPNGGAEIYWLDVPDDGKEHEERPYEANELKEAREQLQSLTDVSPKSLDQHTSGLPNEKRGGLFPFNPRFVPRDKDIFELFDTTPDLTGADIDVGRFIRDGRELDVLVFWRDVEDPNAEPQVQETREELCPVPFYRFQGAMKELLRKHRAWRWDYLEGEWVQLFPGDGERVYPGRVFLLQKACGGYDERIGWTGKPDEQPSWIGSNLTTKKPIEDADHRNPTSEADWKDIAEHGKEVEEKVRELMKNLPGLDGFGEVVSHAAHLHDWGKAAEPFQSRIKKNEYGKENILLAKAPREAWFHWRRAKRPGFRHELASALALLETVRQAKPDHPALVEPYRPLLEAAGMKADFPPEGREAPTNSIATNSIAVEIARLGERDLNLLLYLLAAHHGKVRLSLRASPKDLDPDARDPCPLDKRQARGVRDGDKVHAWGPNGPTVDAHEIDLHLDPMEAGLSPRYGPSWQERALTLRDNLGPFRLAYLEALVRVADWRASGE
ncbi:MAG: CRISPR-associated helicase Cas3' [Halobacteria archaeon]